MVPIQLGAPAVLTREFSTSSFTAVAKSVMTCPEQILATETLSIAMMLGCSIVTTIGGWITLPTHRIRNTRYPPQIPTQ